MARGKFGELTRVDCTSYYLVYPVLSKSKKILKNRWLNVAIFQWCYVDHLHQRKLAFIDTTLQVTCEYRMQKGACVPLRVHTIVISVQHSEEVSVEDLRRDLMEHVIRAVVPGQYLDEQTVYHLQPSGKFVIGGPQVSN